LLDVPQGGLIDRLMNNASEFIGSDISYSVANYRSQNGMTWKKEADCLSDIIRVGMVDTMAFGCIVSNIVLYISLAVILGCCFWMVFVLEARKLQRRSVIF
jgi:chitin synthase